MAASLHKCVMHRSRALSETVVWGSTDHNAFWNVLGGSPVGHSKWFRRQQVCGERHQSLN